MTEQEIVVKLGEIFKERFMIAESVEIHDDARIDTDLGFDSLDTVEVGMVIEDEFDVIIEDDQWKDIGRLITLATKIKEKL